MVKIHAKQGCRLLSKDKADKEKDNTNEDDDKFPDYESDRYNQWNVTSFKRTIKPGLDDNVSMLSPARFYALPSSWLQHQFQAVKPQKPTKWNYDFDRFGLDIKNKSTICKMVQFPPTYHPQ